MIDTGELAKYLVDAPTPQMHTGSVILGLTLIAHLGLLVLVVGVGFMAANRHAKGRQMLCTLHVAMTRADPPAADFL